MAYGSLQSLPRHHASKSLIQDLPEIFRTKKSFVKMRCPANENSEWDDSAASPRKLDLQSREVGRSIYGRRRISCLPKSVNYQLPCCHRFDLTTPSSQANHQLRCSLSLPTSHLLCTSSPQPLRTSSLPKHPSRATRLTANLSTQPAKPSTSVALQPPTARLMSIQIAQMSLVLFSLLASPN
jgi:hypothetical protein